MAEPQNFSSPSSDELALLSVVIVNYNGLRFLDQCLHSLAVAFSRYRIEIIVVDNASSDGSQEWLRERKDIVYVESSVNTGFTGGNNLGAQHTSGDRLLFINNDTYVASQLDAMIDFLAVSEIGLVGCRLQYGDKRQQFSFGYEHNPLRLVLSWLGLEKRHSLPKVFRRLETDESEYLKYQANVAWVSGACFAIRKADWEKVGGFDTSFFMYCEDVDICRRVREIGLKVVYTPECRVTHYEGAGKSWIGSAALKRTARSYQIFTIKHYGLVPAICVSVCLGSLFLLRAAVFGALSLTSGAHRKIRSEKFAGFSNAATLLLTSLTPSAMKEPNP